MALIDSCKAREPRVIDVNLIKKCLDQQFPKGELGRLMKEEGIPLEEIEMIRFEFMNILKIDHLWVMKSLTKLQLNNNIIEKIEKLDTLVHLKELDLSFNKISKLENLDALVELEKLTFYENFIQKMENMDNQKKLKIFSIGKNNISDMDNVQYLRRFPNLISLNMAHNPCAEKDHFRYYVAAFLPNLVYYEYRKIDDYEREKGAALYKHKLKTVNQADKIEQERRNKIEKEEADAIRNSVSFVEYLNTRRLFDEMFEHDPEGRAFLDLGDDVTDLYDAFQEQFLQHCMEIFEVGQKHYVIRAAEVEQFLKSVETGKLKSQQESIEQMESFMEKRDVIFKEVRKVQALLENDDITELAHSRKINKLTGKFTDLIHATWKELMRIELDILERVAEVNSNFEHVLADLINNFLEEVRAIFANIRSLESTYSDNIGEVTNKFLTNLAIDEDVVVPPSLKDIMADKEALVNAMAATHDAHLMAIDNREDLLVKRSQNYLEEFTTGLTQDEIKRNRYKVLEVNHFLDIQREEFEELTTDTVVSIDSDEGFV